MNTKAFGPALRHARLQHGVSLAEIARQTNVSAELWEQLERNDLGRWPSGIYARAWVRVYAQLVGLDPTETVNEFCREFPNGDRRAERHLREHAAIVDHHLAWRDDPLPNDGDRRQPSPDYHRLRMIHPLK